MKGPWRVGHVDDFGIGSPRSWCGLGDTKHVPEYRRRDGEKEFVNSEVTIGWRALGSEDDVSIWSIELVVHGCGCDRDKEKASLSERLKMSSFPTAMYSFVARSRGRSITTQTQTMTPPSTTPRPPRRGTHNMLSKHSLAQGNEDLVDKPALGDGD